MKEIMTPALLLDVDALDYNIAYMENATEGIVDMRPHYKTAKCEFIVKRQLAAGAKGITCAKTSEACDLADMGVQDILLANQVVQKEKLDILAKIALRTKLTVCVDNEANIDALDAAAGENHSVIHIYVEYGIGRRCGTLDYDEFIKLAKYVASKKNLSFDGIQAYAGQLSHEFDLNTRESKTAEFEASLVELKRRLTDAGLPPKEISGLSTGNTMLKKPGTVYTESQAGSYVYMDACYDGLNLPFKKALNVLATVISVRNGKIITDMGLKACGVDQGAPKAIGFEGDEVVLNEEHGTICSARTDIKIGDKIRFIPGHCCSTVNLYDYMYTVKDGEIVEKIKVTSRGKSI